MSEAVSVRLPAVLSVTLNVLLPDESAAFAGNAAFASDDVMPTVSLVLIKFQQASTERTVTLNGVPAVCGVGVPILPPPATLPGAAVSPGTRSCNLANAPTFTVKVGLVLLVFEPSVMSLAVRVQLPTVQFVRLNDRVPDVSAVFAGNTVFGSVLARLIVGVTLETTFQLSSSALTVTLSLAPAVRAVGDPVLPEAVPGASYSVTVNAV